MADFTGNGIADLAVLSLEWREHLSRRRQGWLPAAGHLRGRPRARRADHRRHQRRTATPTSWSATPTAMSWCCWATATAPSSPTTRPTRPSTLAVADLTGNGSKDIIYADQGLDRVVVDYGGGQIHRARRSGHRPALARRRHAGRPERRRHPRPDRRQQRIEQRADLSRPGQRPVRAGRSTAGMATSWARTRWGSRWPT